VTVVQHVTAKVDSLTSLFIFICWRKVTVSRAKMLKALHYFTSAVSL